ncbi:hypothetical protein SAMN05444370_103331 [Rubrimonas cliftonensis]|uniref:Uncharacterized protein n=1 Tax=Rubrimonas cliftonensis TaxID=89524 RepID=A0A1H3Z1M8_9RHOB|nr:hypothetical protein SAMN05444370_103331 [Rubrimonas cliftonensis]
MTAVPTPATHPLHKPVVEREFANRSAHYNCVIVLCVRYSAPNRQSRRQ